MSTRRRVWGFVRLRASRQWRNQVGAGGAERPPPGSSFGEIFDETYNGDFYWAKYFQQISSNHVRYLWCDVILSILILNFPTNAYFLLVLGINVRHFYIHIEEIRQHISNKFPWNHISMLEEYFNFPKINNSVNSDF